MSPTTLLLSSECVAIYTLLSKGESNKITVKITRRYGYLP